MKIVIGLATFKGREEALRECLISLNNQSLKADAIHVYDNELRPNLYDNGKFYSLHKYNEPIYYLSCDDDLLYPYDYIESMVKAIEEHKTIVTHHGRKLRALNISYYKGHQSFRCLGVNHSSFLIDVAGTGVTAFRTDYFNPVNLYKSTDIKMSDLIFSLEAAKESKLITILAHDKGWIKQLFIDTKKSIYHTERKNEERQIELANEIICLNTKKVKKI